MMRASTSRKPATYTSRTGFSTARTTRSSSLNRPASLMNPAIATTSHINAELSTRSLKTRSKQSGIPKIAKLDLQNKLKYQFQHEEVEYDQEPDILEEFGDDPQKLYLTFDLLKTMTPKNCVKYLCATPLFLRTMFVEGKLDPDIVSSVALSLTQSELQKFMLNMTQEMNFFTSISSCNTLTDFETQIPQLVPMMRATIWTKMENADFVTSTTLKAVLPLDESVVGVPFTQKEDYVTGDPGNFKNFSIQYDLPICRGAKSMMLLPITTTSDEVVAVLQLVGLKSRINDEQTEFSPYYVEVFKVVRDLIQKRFFTVPNSRVLPSTVSSIFNDIEKSSLKHTSAQISKFFQNTIPCEQADVFEFDDRYRCLIRFSDGKQFGELEGGVSFAAGISTQPINIPHGQTHPSFNAEIDGQYTSRSLLSKSLLQGRDHFVITLRAKPNAPSFSQADVRLLSEMSTVICDALKVARYLDEQMKNIEKLKREKELLKGVCDTFSNIASSGMDRWNAIFVTAKKLFECDSMFFAVFDGRYMQFLPTKVKCRFEDCAAGTAYNYRETVWTSPEDKRSKFQPKLYEQLNVKCDHSLCFPFRANGRVSGAIELINSKRKEITQEEQSLFGCLCGALLSAEALSPDPL